MYILHVTYELKEGMREEYLQKLHELKIAELTRQEKGNLDYTYYVSPDKENIVFLTEIWESAEDQKAHMQSPHLKMLAEIKPVYVQNTVLHCYDGAVQVS